MSMDGLFIHYLVKELNDSLANSKINKVFQPSPLDVILQVRTKIDNTNKNINLLLSSKLDAPRMLITNAEFQNPDNPNNFCMLLRKYIERGVIKSITQYHNDRIIEISISSFNEMQDEVCYRLIIEIMGRNSNIILVNEDNNIIDAIRKLPPSNEYERTIISHATYTYPKRNKTLSPFDIKQREDILNTEGISKKIEQLFLNMDIDEIHSFLNQKINPTIYTINNKKDLYAFDLYKDVNSIHFNTLSELLDNYYKEETTINKVNTLELETDVKHELKKTITFLDNLNNDLIQAKEILKYEDYVVVLQSNLYKVKKGDKEITLENFLDNFNEITISLDPLLSPSDNLQKMFFKIKKAKKAIERLNILINEVSLKIKYLEDILFQLSIAVGDEIYQIKSDLLNNGIIKNKKNKLKKKIDLKFLIYHIDEFEIYVGKNNIQNDYLTNKFARNNDLWFHVKDIPGSHVIVRIPNNEVKYPLTEKLIRFAANLAGVYSKAKDSSSVPVDYTYIKYIKKIPGVSGFHVTYTNQKTIYIDPDKNKITND